MAPARFSSVVLPQPLRPTRATNSPALTSRETFSKAETVSWSVRYSFVTSSRCRTFNLQNTGRAGLRRSLSKCATSMSRLVRPRSRLPAGQVANAVRLWAWEGRHVGTIADTARKNACATSAPRASRVGPPWIAAPRDLAIREYEPMNRFATSVDAHATSSPRCPPPSCQRQICAVAALGLPYLCRALFAWCPEESMAVGIVNCSEACSPPIANRPRTDWKTSIAVGVTRSGDVPAAGCSGAAAETYWIHQ